MSKLLSDIKVVGFIRAAAGSACVKVLADMGAEVYFIEPLKGHPHRHLAHSYFEMYHADMKSVPVSPRDPEGLELMKKLVAGADVFVSNYRPNVLKKIGLDYETLSRQYPRLIHATLTGYGEKGPMAMTPGFDITGFWAKAGLMNDMMEAGGSQINPPAAMGDIECGKSLATGVIAALYDRTKTGKGMKVTTSLYSEGLYANHCPIIDQQYGMEYPYARKDYPRALKNSFHCKDGWIQAMTLNFDKDFNNFLKVIGREDLIGDPRWTCMKDTEGDKAREMTDILDEAFAKITVDEAIEGFEKYDIACSRFFTGLSTVTDEQAEVNGYFENVVDKNGVALKVPRLPIQFNDEPAEPNRYHSKLGGDTVAVMKELGYTDEKIAEMAAKGAIKVAE